MVEIRTTTKDKKEEKRQKEGQKEGQKKSKMAACTSAPKPTKLIQNTNTIPK